MIDTVPTAGSRWRILAFAVFLAAIGTVLGQSTHSIASAPGKISKRFQLALQINSERIKAGLPVMVIATLRNISTEVGQVYVTMDDWDYDFVVVDSSGKQVAKTEYGRWLADGERMGRVLTVDVPPGGEIRKEFDLARLYVLKEPGRYYVRAVRAIAPESGTVAARAVSNPVGFAIPVN